MLSTAKRGETGVLQIRLAALADEHVATVCAACRNWRELAAFSTPYWRPQYGGAAPYCGGDGRSAGGE